MSTFDGEREPLGAPRAPTQGPFPWDSRPLKVTKNDRRQGWWEVFWRGQKVGYPTGYSLCETEREATAVRNALNALWRFNKDTNLWEPIP